MSNREAFLTRVRRAAEQGRQYRVHLQAVPADVGYVGAGDDLVQRFCEEATAVGGQTFVVSDVEGARVKLRELLDNSKAQSAVCWRHEVLERVGLGSLVAEASIEALDYNRLQVLPAEEGRARLLACDVGITSCEAAIAETGTLMMCSGPGQERLASLIAPVHIAIIERRQIVADLIDAFAMLMTNDEARQMTNDQATMTKQISNLKSQIGSLPSNVTFITGPSKTGDIELQLTTGVHGPGVWQVIVIDEAAD
ncbi:MAG TPA: lactate utilization protein [Pirellulaceae bacterium]|jgi:L-lactate dehydrogenase complex protein LldG